VSYWDSLPQCSFNGINFPVESSKIEGGQRDHVHEYPHTPGGAPELLGRKLYTFRVVSKFDVNFDSYPGLYPQGLDTLMGYFEQGTTGPLRLSQMPSAVPCYAVQWTRDQSAKCRSGEMVEIVFRENQTSLFLFSDLVDSSNADLTDASADLAEQLADVQSQLSTGTMNLFGQLADLVSSAVAWGQQLEGTFSSQYYDAVLAIQTISGNIDAQPDMQSPTVWPVINSLHALWQNAIQSAQQQNQAGAKLKQYVVPATTDIGSICTAIYNGNSSQVSSLLSLNAIPDPLSVRAGTIISYFPQS
jgi:hypothetical protein